jgi:dTDP-4-dehydrorhamnose 3,5-epimerase
MKFVPLQIPGAYRIDLSPHKDQRGFFVRTYDESFFKEQGLVTHWVQESHSFSAVKGTLRGLHFQRAPYAETKLIRAALGKIFMVMVDVRKGSNAFGTSVTTLLSADDPTLLYVPQGLALGMYTLTDNCILLYKMDSAYHPESQEVIRWNDPDINIRWPLEGTPVISERDAAAPSLKEYIKKAEI